MGSPRIPILLLKTPSTPHDAYAEYLSEPRFPSSEDGEGSVPSFEPVFVPVLEHRSNADNFKKIEALVRDGTLADEYGGMIFTSQRAVEAFAGVVENVKRQKKDATDGRGDGRQEGDQKPEPVAPVRYPTFPIYTVGPATARALTSLLLTPPGSSTLPTTFSSSTFQPKILGSHTGDGASLARYILQHYNTLHADHIFTHYEAPRLPFIPLLGPGAQQYVPAGRRRMEREDPRLRKKPLLFLVGEQRRDVIPASLAKGWVAGETSQDGFDDASVGKTAKPDPRGRRRKRDGRTGEFLRNDDSTDGVVRTRDPNAVDKESSIQVDEVEVYTTRVMEGFESDFQRQLHHFHNRPHFQTLQNNNPYNKSSPPDPNLVVVVVFSPSGTEATLKCLGFIDERKQLTPKARRRQQRRTEENHGLSEDDSTDHNDNTTPKYVVATIGPTTRDHLRRQYGFEPDVCAETPTPQKLGVGIVKFLRRSGLG